MKLFARRFYKYFKTIENEFIGKPINVLEIGVFLGSTAELLINKVCTHPDSRYYGIDPWEWFKPLHKRWPTKEKWEAGMILNKTRLIEQYKGKAEFIQGYSQKILKEQRWKDDSFDLIYIDGNHTIMAVLNDFVLTWPLLKVGGIMIFDDYLQGNDDEVKRAVDVILQGLWGKRHFDRKRKRKIDILWKSYSVAMRRIR